MCVYACLYDEWAESGQGSCIKDRVKCLSREEAKRKGAERQEEKGGGGEGVPDSEGEFWSIVHRLWSMVHVSWCMVYNAHAVACICI